MARVLWYLLLIAPPIMLAVAISERLTAHSADEAFGEVFISAPFVLAALILAPVVLAATLSSRSVSGEARTATFMLCAAFVPMYGIILVTEARLGWPASDSWRLWAGVLVLVNGGWLVLLVKLRRWLRRCRVA